MTLKHWLLLPGFVIQEDATVNGVEDKDGSLMPFMEGGKWCPVINFETGIIKDWPKGTTADIHYKVCDDGSYSLIDETGESVLAIIEDYVPSILSPKENGYGDYIIMDVDENGQIADWLPDITDFTNEQV